VTRLVADSALSVLCLLSESPCRSKWEDGTVPLVRVEIEPREMAETATRGREGPLKHGHSFDALRA
jgi:hypothetical protein